MSMFAKLFSPPEITIDYTSIPLPNINTSWGFMAKAKTPYWI